MSYLVLARKFRPLTFEDVSGQEQVTRTLINAIKRNKIAHAYLFAGPRGVGKTSIARIFSKALNCKNGPTPTPCLECDNCRAIAQGTSLAVREIDGASHNSVDNVRELIESFRALPAPGSIYKIYIIDEVHMLSTSAFNALLKSLEEPPPHTVFILATTELHKIPETVISRCQRHDFRALPPSEIEERLTEISKAEGMIVEDEVIRLIGRLADGSMRDAQSLLDRVHSFCEGKVTSAEAVKVLGVVDRPALSAIAQAVISRNSAVALDSLSAAFSRGVDPALFLKEFATYWRELLLAQNSTEEGLSRAGISPSTTKDLKAEGAQISPRDLLDLTQLAREGADSALRSNYPRYALEALLVRMATREPVKELSELISLLRAQAGQVGANTAHREPVSSPEAGVKERIRPVSEPSAQARAPISDPVPTVSTSISTQPGSLTWEAFVGKVGSGGARMLHEQLKRLAVSKFSVNELVASGPDFTVNYLELKENREKMLGFLDQLMGAKTCRIKIERARGEQTDSSLLVKEERQRLESRRGKEADLANHPKVKSLQKIFPGSKVEVTKVKD